jgi:hypothetical protein
LREARENTKGVKLIAAGSEEYFKKTFKKVCLGKINALHLHPLSHKKVSNDYSCGEW